MKRHEDLEKNIYAENRTFFIIVISFIYVPESRAQIKK